MSLSEQWGPTIKTAARVKREAILNIQSPRMFSVDFDVWVEIGHGVTASYLAEQVSEAKDRIENAGNLVVRRVSCSGRGVGEPIVQIERQGINIHATGEWKCRSDYDMEPLASGDEFFKAGFHLKKVEDFTR